ncbi:MAG: hypothetical protein E7605_00035 [Ruminococcaceae bacterium]|nr:hypothetical protein [Oscillospiraceae bacterium]
MELFFEIFLAAFAVFGLWCAFCLAAQSLFASRCVGTVIEVLDRETAANLPMLLEEVRHAPFARRRAPLIVLYSAELCLTYGEPSEAEREWIESCGGRWFVVQIKNN